MEISEILLKIAQKALIGAGSIPLKGREVDICQNFVDELLQHNKPALLNELVGIIPDTGMDAKTIKEERLANKYNENII